MSAFIGVVYDTLTLEIVAVINPDNDDQLNDPAHYSGSRTVLRLPRAGIYQPNAMTPAHCAHAVAEARRVLNGSNISRQRHIIQ